MKWVPSNHLLLEIFSLVEDSNISFEAMTIKENEGVAFNFTVGEMLRTLYWLEKKGLIRRKKQTLYCKKKYEMTDRGIVVLHNLRNDVTSSIK